MTCYNPLPTFSSISSLQKSNIFLSPRLESSQKILDSNFALYSPQRKSYTTKSKNFSYKNNIELTAPVNLFNYKSHQSVKIQRELNSLSKTYNKDALIKQNLRNRPILNLERGEFDFSHQNVISILPSNKIMVTTIHSKKYSHNNKHSKAVLKKHSNVYLVTAQNKQNNRDEFNSFMKDLSLKKKC